MIPNSKLVQRIQDEQHVLALAHAGLSYNTIAAEVGLSYNQVNNILFKYKVKVRDYRDGKTPHAKKLIRASHKLADKMFEEILIEGEE